MDTRNFSRSLINLVSLLSLVALAGCVMTPPIRVPTAIRTASGPVETFANWQTPVVGVITRKQVDEQYHAFAINSGVPNLFLGEFDKSTWAMLPERLWGTNNIIAVFDEKDVLKSFEIVPQDKLFSRFVKLQQAGTFPPLNLSRPISMSAMMADLGQKRISRMFVTNRESVSVLLTSSGLILTPCIAGSVLISCIGEDTLIPAAQVRTIESADNGIRLNFSSDQIVFGGRQIKHIVLELPLSDVLTVIRWHEQAMAQ